jgi:hypothetical protein
VRARVGDGDDGEALAERRQGREVHELGDEPAAHDPEAHPFSCDRRRHTEIGSLAD